MNTTFKITVASAGVAALAAIWVGNREPEVVEQMASVGQVSTVSVTPVLTVLNSAPAGTPFSELQLGKIEIKSEQLSDQFIIDAAQSMELLQTKQLVRDIVAGSPLLQSDFLDSSASLSGQIKRSMTQGMRAIAIQVSPETAAAGLILPGDRVDVISTRQSGESELLSSILIRGCRVLAIDQTLAAADATSPLPPPTTITLEVTPEGATAIALARELGNLSVVISTATEMSSVLPADGALRTTTDLFFQPGNRPVADDDTETTVVIRRGIQVETSRVFRGPELE